MQIKLPVLTDELVELVDGVQVPKSLAMVVDPENGGPVLRLEVEVDDDGMPRCREIRLTAQPGGEDVGVRHLKMVAVDALVAFALSQSGFGVVEREEDGVTTIWPMWGQEAERNIRREVERRRARRTITPEFLREVAEVYRANIGSAPTQAVADKWGVQHRAAARWVQQARKERLLGDAPGPGRAGEAPRRRTQR